MVSHGSDIARQTSAAAGGAAAPLAAFVLKPIGVTHAPKRTEFMADEVSSLYFTEHGPHTDLPQSREHARRPKPRPRFVVVLVCHFMAPWVWRPAQWHPIVRQASRVSGCGSTSLQPDRNPRRSANRELSGAQGGAQVHRGLTCSSSGVWRAWPCAGSSKAGKRRRNTRIIAAIFRGLESGGKRSFYGPRHERLAGRSHSGTSSMAASRFITCLPLILRPRLSNTI